jgi:hypothetical protein
VDIGDDETAERIAERVVTVWDVRTPSEPRP